MQWCCGRHFKYWLIRKLYKALRDNYHMKVDSLMADHDFVKAVYGYYKRVKARVDFKRERDFDEVLNIIVLREEDDDEEEDEEDEIGEGQGEQEQQVAAAAEEEEGEEEEVDFDAHDSEVEVIDVR